MDWLGTTPPSGGTGVSEYHGHRILERMSHSTLRPGVRDLIATDGRVRNVDHYVHAWNTSNSYSNLARPYPCRVGIALQTLQVRLNVGGILVAQIAVFLKSLVDDIF